MKEHISVDMIYSLGIFESYYELNRFYNKSALFYLLFDYIYSIYINMIYLIYKRSIDFELSLHS